MQHDLLDRAFVKRLQESNLAAVASSQPSSARVNPVATSLLDRLIEAAPTQWCAAAEAIERAIDESGGSRCGSDRPGFVLAVVSRRPKDGCTTFVDGLVRTLCDRGTDAVRITFDQIDHECETVQIVDAGNWFGSGPIRRERATALGEACNAAILLRRADRSTAAAFARALEVAGVRVLGEVTTFGRDPTTVLEATA